MQRTGRPNRRLKIASFILLVSIVALSLATMPTKSRATGDAILSGAQIPPDVRAVLERSCRDCHSEATHYPWYSYVAPVSFLIRSDVIRGREHLNFPAGPNIPFCEKNEACPKSPTR